MFGSIFDRSARKDQVEVTPACSTNMRASSFVVLDLKVGGRRPLFPSRDQAIAESSALLPILI
jgi:hypothetical protein